MGKHEKNETRCPLGGRVACILTTIMVIFNTIICTPKVTAKEYTGIQYSEPIIFLPEETHSEIIDTPEIVLKTNDEIVSEINAGLWGNGSEREERLTSAGYNYNEIQSIIDKKYVHNAQVSHVSSGKGLTKSSGVYWNSNTGLKETWYSEKVLPGYGLKIPGRHVNSEGFVCDQDGYICVSSSTYPKGTIIETSRGIGKVYDSGCAPGVLDIYVNW